MTGKHKIYRSPVNIQQLFLNLLKETGGDFSKFQDTKLVCKDETIFISRLLLTLAFPVIERALSFQMEVNEAVIILPDFSAEDIREAVKTFLSETETDSDSGICENIGVMSELNQEVNSWQDEDYADFKDEEIKCEIDVESVIHSNYIEPCPKCRKDVFQNIEEWHLHVKFCQLIFKCNFCQERFKTEDERQIHEESYKADGGGLKCRFDTCDNIHVFEDKKWLVRHINQLHETDKDTAYNCYFCAETFTGKAFFKHHMKRYKDGPKNYKCPEENCGTRFKTKVSLLAHFRNHRGECEFGCETCGKLFSTSYSMKAHMKGHDNVNCICPICAKLFKNKLRLKNHLYTTHADVETKTKHKCDQCDRGFPTKQILMRHIVTAHTGVRDFTCPECGKKFMTKLSLDNHEKIHTGEKPYSCTICDKRFITSNKVKRHQVVHTGAMEFNCCKCGKEFNQKVNRNTHQKKCTGSDVP